MSQVRENLLKDPTYAPYCMACRSMARMRFTGAQFRCGCCGCTTEFEPEFVAKLQAFRAASVPVHNDPGLT